MKLKRLSLQIAFVGLAGLPAWVQAAGLGRLTVNSALGQPLSAEIEIFTENKAEFDSLNASLASEQAYRDARVEITPVLSSLRFNVERRPNGRAVLKITSARPVNEPFIDMLVELAWASGRLVREYTLLLDPPGMAAPQTVQPVAVTPVVTPAAPAQPAPRPAPQTYDADDPGLVGAVASPSRAASRPAPAEPVTRDRPSETIAGEAAGVVSVRRGDTLTAIARQVRPEGVTLEQTLVGLYNSNRNAFDGNMNRLRAGAQLEVPDAAALSQIALADARREIRIQAEDWRAYRQQLAGAVAAAEPASNTPAATTGTIRPKVEDRARPAPAAPQDVLTLSKPPASSEKAAEPGDDAIARQKAMDEAAERAAALEKQVADLKKLAELQEQQATPAGEAAAPEPPEPAVAVPVEPPVAPETAAESPLAALFANPLYWAGGLGLLGLGGALWWVGARRRRAAPMPKPLEDSVMTAGEIQASVAPAGATGASVNTGDTSFLTDFSKAGLGTIDTHDVDPIAEAEVYMAYGRDAQAEEILREAVDQYPDRPEIRAKLLEIHAARKDAAAFQNVAGALIATLGTPDHPLWTRACELGRSIDPTNPLYAAGKTEAAPGAAVTALAPGAGIAATLAEVPDDTSSRTADSIGQVQETPVPETPVAQAEPAEPAPLDFTFSAPAEPAGETVGFQNEGESQAEADDTLPAFTVSDDSALSTNEPGFRLELPDEPPAPEGAGEPTDSPLTVPGSQSDVARTLTRDDLEFVGLTGQEAGQAPDFGDLDLDLGLGEGDDALDLDEVATKLELARAYIEMGDREGAREILDEVLAEGNDAQKADAQALIDTLG